MFLAVTSSNAETASLVVDDNLLLELVPARVRQRRELYQTIHKRCVACMFQSVRSKERSEIKKFLWYFNYILLQ